MHLKLLHKNQFKKRQKQLVIWLVIELLKPLQVSSLPQNNSKREKEIQKERYIYIHQIIDELRLT